MRALKLILVLLVAGLLAGSAAAQDEEVIAQAYRTVNVRSGPGTQYAIIGQLNSGNEALITGRSDDSSDWLRISFQGGDGWVAYFTVTILGDPSTVELVELPPPGAVIENTPSSMATQSVSAVYVTAYRTVNVRGGPGLEYTTLGNLDAGSIADVAGKSVDGEWLEISFNNQPGWVAFFVVNLNGSLENIAVAPVSASAVTEEAPSLNVEVSTLYNVNLHQQPTLNSLVLAVVPFNTTLQALARSDESASWLSVLYEGHTGWVLSTLISTSTDLGNLPIESTQ